VPFGQLFSATLHFSHRSALPLSKGTGKKQQTRSFYTLQDFEEWEENNGNEGRGWQIKYYKGLGTSTSKEGKGYFKDLTRNRIYYTFTGKTDKAFDLAFSKEFADKRKQWLMKYDRDEILDTADTKISYDDFIHKELIHFSQDDLERSIPGIDGLKVSQRKILYTFVKKNITRDIKVSSAAGLMPTVAQYHHGEASAQAAITSMAQCFCGANNVNLLHPSGQFGTEISGGADAASPRYIFTRQSEWLPLLFSPLDEPLYDYQQIEGSEAEPVSYLPLLPLVLLNGAKGIGTGFSTSIPSYNPLDIGRCILSLLEKRDVEAKFKEPEPWWRGFEGTVKKAGATGGWLIRGEVELNKEKSTVRVTALPVGFWIDNFKAHLDKLREAKKIVSYNNMSILEEDELAYTIDFRIKFHPEHPLPKKEALIKLLKLEKKVLTSNMHMFNENGVIKKFKNATSIIRHYYPLRLGLYNKRRKHYISKWKQEIRMLRNKMRFLEAVMSDELILKRKKKAMVEKELEKAKYCKVDDSYSYLLSMPFTAQTEEKLSDLGKQINTLQENIISMEKETAESLWRADLQIFLARYEDSL
jgi:DNA topoisomerase-2